MINIRSYWCYTWPKLVWEDENKWDEVHALNEPFQSPLKMYCQKIRLYQILASDEVVDLPLPCRLATMEHKPTSQLQDIDNKKPNLTNSIN